jgi:hypothetical protein
MILESFGFSTRKTIAIKINRRIVLKPIRMIARSGLIIILNANKRTDRPR